MTWNARVIEVVLGGDDVIEITDDVTGERIRTRRIHQSPTLATMPRSFFDAIAKLDDVNTKPDTNSVEVERSPRTEHRCHECDSGGARCELVEGHDGQHACPQQIFLSTTGR